MSHRRQIGVAGYKSSRFSPFRNDDSVDPHATFMTAMGGLASFDGIWIPKDGVTGALHASVQKTGADVTSIRDYNDPTGVSRPIIVFPVGHRPNTDATTHALKPLADATSWGGTTEIAAFNAKNAKTVVMVTAATTQDVFLGGLVNSGDPTGRSLGIDRTGGGASSFIRGRRGSDAVVTDVNGVDDAATIHCIIVRSNGSGSITAEVRAHAKVTSALTALFDGNYGFTLWGYHDAVAHPVGGPVHAACVLNKAISDAEALIVQEWAVTQFGATLSA